MKKTITILGLSLAVVYGLSGGDFLFAQHGGGIGVHGVGGVGLGGNGAGSISAGSNAGVNAGRGAGPDINLKSNNSTSASATSVATTRPPAITAGSRIDSHLQENTALSARLQTLLPAGTNLGTAAKGFKNFGQFVAAAHVSRTLNIPFSQVKARMIAGESLGKTIHELEPGMTTKQAKAAAATANKEADADIKASAKAGVRTGTHAKADADINASENAAIHAGTHDK